jgi:hypothetical protein
VGSFVSSFAECICRYSAKLASLPSAKATTLSKVALPVPSYAFFAKCYDLDTRQSISLPSVTLGKVTRLHFYLFLLFQPNKQKIYHIIITYTSHISHNNRIHNRDHIFHKKTQITQVFHKHVYVHTKFHQHKYYQL